MTPIEEILLEKTPYDWITNIGEVYQTSDVLEAMKEAYELGKKEGYEESSKEGLIQFGQETQKKVYPPYDPRSFNAGRNRGLEDGEKKG